MEDPTAKAQMEVSMATFEAILSCLEACAEDDREPERYRDWYQKSLVEVRTNVVLILDGEGGNAG